MRRHSWLLSVCLGLASSAMAIFQMDVAADRFPEGREPTSGTLYLLGNPTAFDATIIAGADGFPLAWHVIFNYDAVVGGGAVDHVELTAECEGGLYPETQTWTPAPFTVFYTPGPAFPVNGVYEVFGSCAGPEANFAADEPVGVLPHAVQFTSLSAAGAAPIVEWRWDFGDGATSSDENPSHVYQQLGQFDVQLVVVDDEGGADSLRVEDCVEVIPYWVDPDYFEYAGSFNNHDYWLSRGPWAWSVARDLAVTHGGHLATVLSTEENDFIVDALGGLTGGFPAAGILIGASDAAVEGDWGWVTGEEWAYENWSPGEPDNSGGVEDYLEMEGSPNLGTWNDLAGNIPLRALMEIDQELVECDFESFDHGGALPAGWSVQSQGGARSQPWHAVLESGSDWAIETTQAQFELPYEEWLISPLFDRSEFLDNQLSFYAVYDQAASSASVRVSRNGGLSYTTVLDYDAGFEGAQVVDIAALADGEPDVRVAFVFSGEFLVGGARWRLDNVQICGVSAPPVASAPLPAQPMGLPSNDRHVTVGCTFSHPYGVDGSSLQVRIDANGDGDYLDGGAEDWTQLPAQPGGEAVVVEHPATYLVNGNGLAFEFRAKSMVSDLWGYSGFAGLEGHADDWSVWILAEPPTATLPVPAQPMAEAWPSRDISIGCTFEHPVGVDGSSLQVRIDANGDGDYAGGGAEAWTDLPDQPDATSLVVEHLAHYDVNGSGLAFEFRSLSLASDLVGYSGAAGQPGIADDWSVWIMADFVPPVLSDPLPAGQPDPAWTPSLTAAIGVTATDELSGVDASSLQRRTDWNRDGDYGDAGELWMDVTGYADQLQILVSEDVTFPADGGYTFQYRVSDVAGNGPVTSGDVVVRVDATPPTASTLFAQGSGSESVTLNFSPTSDVAFERYLLSVSSDSTVTEEDPVWSVEDDPAMGIQGTYQTTVHGLALGQRYWFRLRARDLAGNVSAWSNRVSRATEGAPLVPVDDLVIQRGDSGLELVWTAPQRDIYGSPLVYVEGYDVHSSEQPWFEPNASTRIATVTEPRYGLASRTDDDRVFYRVIAVGGGAGSPVPGMALVPAGTFTMGPDPWGNGAAHEVTITRPYWLDLEEVTNLEYMLAVQWAYDEGLVTATEASVQAYGVELLDLDAQAYSSGEIRFDAGSGQFYLVELDDITVYGWGPGQAYPDGYDPSLHPVKEVSWYGAACYCDWLSQRAGLPLFYDGDWSVDAAHNPYETTGYRLPTEAEWEMAARWNDGRLFPWGNNFPIGCEPLANQLLCVGWTRPTGSYPLGATQLGFLDMTGNIVEWMNDWYEDVYQPGPVNDPIGPPTGSWRVMRGSDFGDAHVYYSETTARQYSGPSYSATWIGFRTVLPTGGAGRIFGETVGRAEPFAADKVK